MMRSLVFITLLSISTSFAALAKTADDPRSDGNTFIANHVYGMGYFANGFSALTHTNERRVSKLIPEWAYSPVDPLGGEAFPVAGNGIFHVTPHNAMAAQRKRIWRVIHDHRPRALRVVCCKATRLMALNANTDKWMVSYAMAGPNGFRRLEAQRKSISGNGRVIHQNRRVPTNTLKPPSR